MTFDPDRLSQLRDAKGLSRTQLHHELVLLGVRRCRDLLDRWERGQSEPRATDLQALALALEVPMEAFFSQQAS